MSLSVCVCARACVCMYYGGRDLYCTGGWGKTGYYYYHYMLLEEGTRITWAECEDGAMYMYNASLQMIINKNACVIQM